MSEDMIKRIIIEIDGENVEVPLEDVIKLRNELNRLTNYPPPPTSVVDWSPGLPPIYCGTATVSKDGSVQ